MRLPPERRREEARRLSPVDVEAVLTRAIELHVREQAEPLEERLPESELVRIGGEVGLPAEHIRRALAEVDGGLRTGSSWLDRHLGAGTAGASRVVDTPAADAERALDRYLREWECMVVERRFSGRTTYVRGTGLMAMIERGLGRVGSRHALLSAERIDVAVQALGATRCCVVIAVDLGRARHEAAAVAATGAVLGSVGAGAAGVVVAAPLALIALPVAGAAFVGARLAYRNSVEQTQRRVESLLDRLEHGELAGRASALLAAFRG